MLRVCVPRRTPRAVYPAISKCLSARHTGRRKYATVTDLSNYPKVGEHLHGFTLQRTKHVPELELTALHLRHDRTGAEYLHVARDDKNNVFSIGFKTNPPDDTGVPHILEHTTLCGSQKSVLGFNCMLYSCVHADDPIDIQFAIPSSRCCQDLSLIS
jgi:hypothetical protein